MTDRIEPSLRGAGQRSTVEPTRPVVLAAEPPKSYVRMWIWVCIAWGLSVGVGAAAALGAALWYLRSTGKIL